MEERTVTHIPAKPLNVLIIDHPFRVAAYCRVSSPSEEQKLSLETQITYYTDKINGNTFWKNAGVFADTATGRIWWYLYKNNHEAIVPWEVFERVHEILVAEFVNNVPLEKL